MQLKTCAAIAIVVSLQACSAPPPSTTDDSKPAPVAPVAPAAPGAPAAATSTAATPAWARPLTDRTFERTPVRLERGRYLVEGPAHCFLCHSDSNWSAGGQPVAGGKGSGRLWTDYTTLPWAVSPNITPDPETGAGKWTDDMLARAIREGVGHDGRALFFMPWEHFRVLSDEDLASVIVYLRSIPPVRAARPKMELPPPVKASLKPIPITAPVPEPVFASAVDRGKYLVEIGQCAGCHSTYDEQQQPVAGLTFAGGLHLEGGWGNVTTPNLTRHPSGLAHYTPELFVQTIRSGKMVARKLNPVMPWSYFRKMTDEDLKAIFAYLRTVPPAQHRVNNTDPPTYCPVCKGKHGLGDRNVVKGT